jgi:hypothetical protein
MRELTESKRRPEMYLVAVMVLLIATAAAAQTPKPGMLQNSVKEAADRTPLKPGTVIRDYFKDFRPGACKSPGAATAPNTSWPARGDTAVTFCRER